jgi:hypothetical protein
VRVEISLARVNARAGRDGPVHVRHRIFVAIERAVRGKGKASDGAGRDEFAAIFGQDDLVRETRE